MTSHDTGKRTGTYNDCLDLALESAQIARGFALEALAVPECDRSAWQRHYAARLSSIEESIANLKSDLRDYQRAAS